MTEDYGKCEEYGRLRYGRFRGGRRRGDGTVRKLPRVCGVVSARLARWLSLPVGKTRTVTISSVCVGAFLWWKVVTARRWSAGSQCEYGRPMMVSFGAVGG